MTARVLVVDDIPANVKLLEAQLMAEYFDVVTATGGQQAIDICVAGGIDVVLLDVMMPGLDGFEVCRRLKADARTCHIPIIMVTALDQTADKVRGLDSGADDFLQKPVDEVALLTRVKSLARLKTLVDELRLRSGMHDGGTGTEFDFITADDAVLSGRILLVEDRPSTADRIVGMLEPTHSVQLEVHSQSSVFRAAEGDFDMVIVSLSLEKTDGLRLCSQLRSLERTRHLPIIMLVEQGDRARLLRGLDMGVNDYVTRPVDRNELKARVRTQLRRARYTDQLRDTMQQNVELAVTDALTQLHNRRYMESHLATLVGHASDTNKPLAVLLADIDHFKSVNDTHGHEAGDEVLREFARRLRTNFRGVDMCCRYGGEEFVVIMPETDRRAAQSIAERLRQCIANEPFTLGNGRKIQITVSVGIAVLQNSSDTPETILRRSDQALYMAKREGRNRVVCDAA